MQTQTVPLNLDSLYKFQKENNLAQRLLEEQPAAGPIDPRVLATTAAFSGIGRKEFSGDPICQNQISIIQRLIDGLQYLKSILMPAKPLPLELRKALRETTDAKSWIAEDGHKILKHALEKAFADGKQPEIISQQGNILRVIKSDDIEITIGGGVNKNSHFKISANLGRSHAGLEILNDSQNPELYRKLVDFVAESKKEPDPIATPEILNDLLQNGTIVHSESLDFKQYRADGKVISLGSFNSGEVSYSITTEQIWMKDSTDKIYTLEIQHRYNADTHLGSTTVSNPSVSKQPGSIHGFYKKFVSFKGNF